jgi:hypothetical protein
MTTHTFVQVATDGAGKKIDCGPSVFTDASGNVLFRQVGQIGDPTALDGIANVKSPGVAPSSADAALVITNRDILETAGAPITGATMPTGGLGLTGWLSAIWKALTGTLTVSGTVTVSGAVTANTTATNPSAIYVTRFTPGLTATQIPSQALVNGVVIKALKANVGTVFIGMSNAVTDEIGGSPGYPLVAGEACSVAVTNLSAVWAIADNTTDAVAIIGN